MFLLFSYIEKFWLSTFHAGLFSSTSMISSFISRIFTSTASSIPALRFSSLVPLAFWESTYITSLLLRRLWISRITKISAIVSLIWSTTTSTSTWKTTTKYILHSVHTPIPSDVLSSTTSFESSPSTLFSTMEILVSSSSNKI